MTNLLESPATISNVNSGASGAGGNWKFVITLRGATRNRDAGQDGHDEEVSVYFHYVLLFQLT